MKLTKLLALLLAMTLFVVPAALADDGDDDDDASDDAGGSHRSERSQGHGPRDNESDDNETDDDADAEDEDEDDDADDNAHDGRNETRAAEREAFRAEHKALVHAFVAALKDLHASWHENATAIREGCHSADLDHKNASKEDRTEHAQCVKDGYAAWRAERRADLKELREELRELVDSWHPHHDSA